MKTSMKTIKQFLRDYAAQTDLDPEHLARLKSEWDSLPMGMYGEIIRREVEWPELWDAYDERMAIITEGRKPTDEDVRKAWLMILDEAQAETRD